MEFSERLKEIREEQGQTQKKVGEALNYGSSAIANYESGRNQPSINDIKRLAEYFHVTTDYLPGYASSPKNINPNCRQLSKNLTLFIDYYIDLPESHQKPIDEMIGNLLTIFGHFLLPEIKSKP